jgi:activator of 2-hydroxyglutaryl-CoA dehydratase
MNEACSAGTGSFLEESATNPWGSEMEDIAPCLSPSGPQLLRPVRGLHLLRHQHRPQEGISREDIVAGLVYSICINYVNR